MHCIISPRPIFKAEQHTVYYKKYSINTLFLIQSY